MWNVVFMLCIAALLPRAEQTPSFLISAPNIVHVAVEETVAIQFHGANNAISVNAYFEDEITRVRLSNEAVFDLNDGNNFQDIKKILIKPDMLEKAEISKRRKKPYVLLVAESEVFPRKKINTRILLSTKKGYLFIQTDKPIYTPHQKVLYRVFTLDNYMRPVDEKVEIMILNSKGMVVHTSERQSRKMASSSLEIPDIAEPGKWKIVAWFRGFEMSRVFTEFEVMKYELPTFEVKIVPSQLYYLVKNKDFSVDIFAKHTYGKEITGSAYVRFGFINDKDKVIFLPGLEQYISMKNGKVSATLKTEDLERKINHTIKELEGLHLYIAVTVVEKASGEIREDEYRDVKIVSSPYVISLSKTKGFFVPGAPFSIMASITYVDGSPASNVPVTAEVKSEGGLTIYTKTEHSSNGGVLSFESDIPISANQLNVMVKAVTEKEGISMTVKRYQSPNKNFLGITVPNVILGPGEKLAVTLKDIHQQSSGNLAFFYYMIVTKGKVLLMQRIPSSNKKIFLAITKDMVPAFRLLVYYFIENSNGKEIVADSVWIDIDDVCEGKVKVTPDKDMYHPEETMSLTIETDHAGTVALAIVDTAVFILNKKNKLTSKKVFNAMNAYDLGCSAGGGTNNVGVFTDAGLAFISDTISSTMREDFDCPTATERSKRSATFHQQISELGRTYQDAETQQCCHAGMKLNPMRFPCDQRLSRVTGSKECREAFKNCCEKATALRKDLAKRQNTLSVARKMETKDEDVFDKITLRSSFPESWGWTTVVVKQPRIQREKPKHVPDSITTWEIQAVHFHDEGFCIAEPNTFKVFKDFFLSMRLPYSVKRHEQLEVKVVVYNYGQELINVNVSMKADAKLCSPSTSGKNTAQFVSVASNSAEPVYFSVVPMAVGELPIIVAAVSSTGEKDGVHKKLIVVSEGVLRTEDTTKTISGKDRSCKIDLEKPRNAIPESTPYALMSFKGDIMGESIENCLNAETIDTFIKVPRGCGEQTMVKMAPAMSAIEYLDASEQWVQLKTQRKEEALDMIDKGYIRMQNFQKPDGSFGAYINYPSSTWLTAFVAKVFTKSRNYINVQDRRIHNAISYLLNSQQDDGSFHDPHPVMDRKMQGGVRQLGEDVSLTAFVAIALHHARQTYQSNELSEVTKSLEKALTYLNGKLSDRLDSYSIAITAYALKLVKPNSAEAEQAETLMRKKSTFHEGNETRQWIAATEAISVEATAYALLQTLQRGDIPYAKPIAKWLTEKRNFGGGYSSTQDTVIALEALSKYGIQTLGKDSLNLTLAIHRPGRDTRHKIYLSKRNSLMEQELQFDLGNNVNIDVSGTGSGVISISRMYYSSEQESNTCDDLHLTVTVEGKVNELPSVDDYDDNYNYDDDISMQNDEPVSAIEWYDIRSRRRRDPPPSQSSPPLKYKVCVRAKNATNSNMFLVDVTLLSGLEPITADLDQLMNHNEKYIDFYEFQKGRVLLYFGKITNTAEPECVEFGVIQINNVGHVQPANALLYDFYNPSRRCSIFYSAPNKNNMLSALCQGSVCECAEGPCPRMKNVDNILKEARSNFSCKAADVDYAYVAEIKKSLQKSTFYYYEAKIVKVLKRGRDESALKDSIRQFIARSSCELKVESSKQYLLMGKDGQTIDSDSKMQYLLDAKTWIEEIPSEAMCKASRRRLSCSHLNKFTAKQFVCAN